MTAFHGARADGGSMDLMAGETAARKIFLIIGLLTLCRLLLAGASDLSEDEAYYWLWSNYLSTGYYDHPPMVAYWIKAGVMLFGDTAFGVRVVFVISGLAASALLHGACLSLTRSASASALVALWFNAMLIANTLFLVATPDTPLIVFTCLALFALAKLTETGRGVWWLLVGAALGLAFLSKYTAALLVPGVFLWMAATPFGRRWFLSPFPYLGALIAFAVVAPMVYWNATHEWASFAKQIEHGVKDKPSSALASVVEFLGGQAGAVTPLIFVFCLVGGALAFARGWRQRDEKLLLSAAVFIPPFAFFLVHSLSQKIQVNWPGFLYATAILAAVPTLIALKGRVWPGLFRLAPVVGLIFTVVAFVQLGFSLLPVPAKLDPTQKLKGWAELARHVEEARKSSGAELILTDRYAITGALAFNMRRPLGVVQVNQRIRYAGFPPPDEGVLMRAPALLIVRSGQDVGRILAHFAHASLLTKLRRNAGLDGKDTYDVHLLSGYRGGLFAAFPPF